MPYVVLGNALYSLGEGDVYLSDAQGDLIEWSPSLVNTLALSTYVDPTVQNSSASLAIVFNDPSIQMTLAVKKFVPLFYPAKNYHKGLFCDAEGYLWNVSGSKLDGYLKYHEKKLKLALSNSRLLNFRNPRFVESRYSFTWVQDHQGLHCFGESGKVHTFELGPVCILSVVPCDSDNGEPLDGLITQLQFIAFRVGKKRALRLQILLPSADNHPFDWDDVNHTTGKPNITACEPIKLGMRFTQVADAGTWVYAINESCQLMQIPKVRLELGLVWSPVMGMLRQTSYKSKSLVESCSSGCGVFFRNQFGQWYYIQPGFTTLVSRCEYLSELDGFDFSNSTDGVNVWRRMDARKFQVILLVEKPCNPTVVNSLDTGSESCSRCSLFTREKFSTSVERHYMFYNTRLGKYVE